MSSTQQDMPGHYQNKTDSHHVGGGQKQADQIAKTWVIANVRHGRYLQKLLKILTNWDTYTQGLCQFEMQLVYIIVIYMFVLDINSTQRIHDQHIAHQFDIATYHDDIGCFY